jgi:alpha-D-ribose 1-methylphosphonate 5-triphosphate synthase subunit PhnG
MTQSPSIPSRERRAELLALAEPDALVALAEQCVESGAAPTVIAGPEVGMVMLTVREPIAQERFHLGEVLVTRAEVEVDGARGWCMRLGDDRMAALAAAICDAEVQAGRAHHDAVLRLCELTEQSDAEARRREWAELGPTEVRFDELD